VAELAAGQHGVVSRRQLHALGWDRFAVRRRVAAGHLHPLHRGVYAVGHVALSWRGTYLAAVLACGPGAALSHRSAADLWGLRRSSARAEVTVPRGSVGPRDLGLHHSRMLDPDDVTELDGIRVTTAARTLLDLAACVTARELAAAVDRSERLEVFDLGAVEGVLARARGRRGAAALREAIVAWQPQQTRSVLEDRFEVLLGAAILRLPGADVLLDGERNRHEVDAFWHSHRLVVQLDGFAYHRTRRDRERDATTDADLELAGYEVLRLTWDDVVVHGSRTARRLRRRLTARGAATRARGSRA
jgi:very-short-patch-repair endonuclease